MNSIIPTDREYDAAMNPPVCPDCDGEGCLTELCDDCGIIEETSCPRCKGEGTLDPIEEETSRYASEMDRKYDEMRDGF